MPGLPSSQHSHMINNKFKFIWRCIKKWAPLKAVNTLPDQWNLVQQMKDTLCLLSFKIRRLANQLRTSRNRWDQVHVWKNLLRSNLNGKTVVREQHFFQGRATWPLMKTWAPHHYFTEASVELEMSCLSISWSCVPVIRSCRTFMVLHVRPVKKMCSRYQVSNSLTNLAPRDKVSVSLCTMCFVNV